MLQISSETNPKSLLVGIKSSATKIMFTESSPVISLLIDSVAISVNRINFLCCDKCKASLCLENAKRRREILKPPDKIQIWFGVVSSTKQRESKL